MDLRTSRVVLSRTLIDVLERRMSISEPARPKPGERGRLVALREVAQASYRATASSKILYKIFWSGSFVEVCL